MRRWQTQPSANRRWLSVIGRLLLALSLWHAPLPMLHAHGTDLVDQASAMTFVDHLVEYHPDTALNSHIDFGWHWHLVPPVNHSQGENSEENCPYCPQDSQDTLPQTQQSNTNLNCASSWTVCVWLSSHPNPVRLTCRQLSTPTTFLDTYLGSVPLGTLLRVARC